MVPCIEILSIIQDGFVFLQGVMTNLQIKNLKLLATSVILHSKFNLSEVSRSWLKERTCNAFSHCLKSAHFSLKKAIANYSKMLQESCTLGKGRFIIDDTIEHHSKLCKFIHGVFKHWDHAMGTNVSAKCLVFLYYSEGDFIKFPIGWRIYYKNGNKTKYQLALTMIRAAIKLEFRCDLVACDSWFCIEPFVKELQRMKLRYVMEIKKNAGIQVSLPKTAVQRRGKKRTKLYECLNIIPYMQQVKTVREIGFVGNLESGKKEKVLYRIKESVCKINALPGSHKVIYSYDPERKTEKYLITNELTWEGLKVVKEYFHRWVIEEFFRNAKQQLNLEGACVRSKQGVTITLLLISCIDALIHRKIAGMVSANSQSEPVTVQSVIRLLALENVENFISVIKSPEGDKLLSKWHDQLSNYAIRKRQLKSMVDYLDLDGEGRLRKCS